MNLDNLLAEMGQRLTAADIPYMVTGSVASSFHGTPRATRDIDVVIDPNLDTLTSFVRALPPDRYYADLDAALMALADRSQFNVIEQASGWKVDFLVRKDRPFSMEEFARRQPAQLLGRPSFVTTAEDLIIAKLEWASAGQSERQLDDVAGVVDAVGPDLDTRYIQRWVSVLGLQEAWSRAKG